MTALSRGARIFGWVFMPRTMLDIRRLRAETMRTRARAAALEGRISSLTEAGR